METGDRGRTALSRGRAPGHRSGGRRSRPQSYAGAWTPDLRPHRLTLNGVGASAPALRVRATRRRTGLFRRLYDRARVCGGGNVAIARDVCAAEPSSGSRPGHAQADFGEADGYIAG